MRLKTILLVPAIVFIIFIFIVSIGPKGSIEILLAPGSWISAILPESVVGPVSTELNKASDALGYIQFTAYLSFAFWVIIGYLISGGVAYWKRRSASRTR